MLYYLEHFMQKITFLAQLIVLPFAFPIFLTMLILRG